MAPVSFKLTNTRTTVVNALRRTVLSDIEYVATYRNELRPKLSQGGFVVKKNTGKLHNDALCDRISLIPIHLSRDETVNFIPGSITVELDVSNEDKSRPVTVTSRNFRVLLFGKPHPNPACFPPSAITGHWPIVTRLFPGERIDLVATLEKGKASTHAAFAVASHVSMVPELDDAAFSAARLAIENDPDISSPERAKRLNYHDHIEKFRLTRDRDDGEPVSIRLDIESECGLSENEILNEAIRELKEVRLASRPMR